MILFILWLLHASSVLSPSVDALQIADCFFLVFHIGLILFSLFGSIWKPRRTAQLFVISLTFSSWGILGIWFGWGYCTLTDWHWEVLYALGTETLPSSYVSYL